MKTKYVVATDELAVMMVNNMPSCAVKLDLISESICISPIEGDGDVPGCTIFDTENAVIFWEIPRLSACKANSLLDHIAPLAKVIISQCRIDIDRSEEPHIDSAHVAMSQISQYIYNMEISAQ